MAKYVIFSVIFVLFCCLQIQPSFQSTSDNGTFCYDLNNSGCGPQSSTEWPGICQTGRHQSPINLPHNFATMEAAALMGLPLNFQVPNKML
jgi:carbonic anhydrase